ncbi:hypothetical protein HMPREF0645_0933 [Hallella bergensis DSM 17361]|uniref:DNA pilot protein n=1 Tax=Hallella bergensis DSM 17361 TaxID=585502 RepID=D1PVE8_9BACT|nr:hypothetical protein [Hallella bergensis]EFA44665.1 hypothetical protein HMPREF0645_0933 [Hallella bergensis DSM 17361]
MPLDPITGGALIAAGSSLLGGALGAAGSSNLNRRNRRHQWDMMLQQQAYNDKVNQQQMDFQREINQQNFAWNDPSNIRKRVEAAGYNPYLYDKQNLGSAQGVNLSSSSAGLGTPSEFNPGAALGEGIRGAATSFYDNFMKQQDIDARKKQIEVSDYEFEKQKKNDALTIGGISPYYSAGLSQIAQIQSAQAAAKINTIQSTFEQWRQEFYSRNAMDENGKPLVDENGEYVSNYDAEQQSNVTRNILGVEKLQQDMLAGKVNIESMEIDKLIKKYDLTFTKPQELENLKQSLSVMQSTIAANNASAQASLAAAYNQLMQGTTEEQSRVFKLGSLNWDRELKAQQHYSNDLNLRERKFNYDVQSEGRDLRGSWFGRYPGALFSTAGDWINRGLGPLLGPLSRIVVK